jgi:hypothetical protein
MLDWFSAQLHRKVSRWRRGTALHCTTVTNTTTPSNAGVGSRRRCRPLLSCSADGSAENSAELASSRSAHRTQLPLLITVEVAVEFGWPCRLGAIVGVVIHDCDDAYTLFGCQRPYVMRMIATIKKDQQASLWPDRGA